MDNNQFLAEKRRSITNIYDGSSQQDKRRRTEFSFLPVDPMKMDSMPWGVFREDLLERVLARLPVSSFFRFRSVCKGWSSIVSSPSFLKACSEVSSRRPWFYMVGSKYDQRIVYDTEVNKWHRIKGPYSSTVKSKPVASAGGLICFISCLGNFVVCNPLTGQCRKLPYMKMTQTIHAITMVTCKKSYKRSPSKEYSSILTSAHSGEEIVYFLNRGGKVVACNTHKCYWYEIPPLLPSTLEYSLDLVDCGGHMLVVVLRELFESATVRIWGFDEIKSEWVQVLAMPPAMSHEYYGKKADINCIGYDNLIMICISSNQFNRVVLCNIVENSWLELPDCYAAESRKAKRAWILVVELWIWEDGKD